jgi:hypothetical protein
MYHLTQQHKQSKTMDGFVSCGRVCVQIDDIRERVEIEINPFSNDQSTQVTVMCA